MREKDRENLLVDFFGSAPLFSSSQVWIVELYARYQLRKVRH